MMKRKNGLNFRTLLAILIILVVAVGAWFMMQNKEAEPITPTVQNYKDTSNKASYGEWIAPDTSTIPASDAGEQIRYGRELIAHTSAYLGPKGKVASISNGMNCQNCHKDAGTASYALNFSAVAATYPQFRARSGSLVSIAGRINACFNRSLNGQSLDTANKEMKAMIAYINWVGKDVPKGIKPENSGVVKLKFLDRAADPQKGKIVYATCQACHGQKGEGVLNDDGTEYTFPPLWGKHSYNDGAGLYRLSNFAGFVKNNMPFGTTYKHPVLSDEDAWDVAAYVNSQPRPHKDQSKDYALTGDKPVDCPFGPYKDDYSETQHKYGPFKPILSAKDKSSKEIPSKPEL